MKIVTIYCDGSGIAGGHPCGFAAILNCDGTRKQVVGSLDMGTNNVAELMAAVIGLEALKTPATVILYSDSKYVVNGMTLGWVGKWASNGWRRWNKDAEAWAPVPNAEYWRRLIAAAAHHRITFQHVKGHNGDPLNEQCDRLAKAARHAHGRKPIPLAYDAAGNRLTAAIQSV